jgi:hypothetical protein
VSPLRLRANQQGGRGVPPQVLRGRSLSSAAGRSVEFANTHLPRSELSARVASTTAASLASPCAVPSSTLRPWLHGRQMWHRTTRTAAQELARTTHHVQAVEHQQPQQHRVAHTKIKKLSARVDPTASQQLARAVHPPGVARAGASGSSPPSRLDIRICRIARVGGVHGHAAVRMTTRTQERESAGAANYHWHSCARLERAERPPCVAC